MGSGSFPKKKKLVEDRNSGNVVNREAVFQAAVRKFEEFSKDLLADGGQFTVQEPSMNLADAVFPLFFRREVQAFLDYFFHSFFYCVISS
jgi:hypothetical protein